ncbi:MAG: heme lyase CcmF/NrfE family subunit [Deltaproteobacteria bacterium]|nr:heme lyase CcmF/NrfE family subunit [Deltaproteobacteria bacterium]
MIINLGYVFLASALAVSLYGVIVPHLGVRRNNWNLVRSAQFASIVNFFLVLGASTVLLRSFLANDFSVRFVWENSSTDLPIFYKITAFWGGMDGSLLFWELVLAGFTAIVAYTYQRVNREIIPYVLVTLNIIHVFLLSLLVSWSNPLDVQSPVPLEGRGLNPLLQHPGMAIHPPLLYLGYIGFAIPFAFAMASLVRGRLDNAWVISTRRWTLGAWYALAMGLMFGGQWAYEELGWGGYWGWDPVENAAFMPWLTGTAFLHSVILQEKRNMMKVWNMVLIIVTFGLSILGTFIVRSGVLNSVHAFAQSEIGPAFLIFLSCAMLVGFYLMFLRIRLLESRHTADSLLSKESVFLLNNLMLVGIAFTVLLGTAFPLVAEAVRGTKLSIQAPFFNTISAPLGVTLLFLIGISSLVAWRQSSWGFLVRTFRIPVLAGLAGLALGLAGGVRHLGALVIFIGAAFTTTVIVIDMAKAVRVRSSQSGEGWLESALATLMRNRQRWGGALIHLGVVCVFVGLAGNYFKSEFNRTLEPGKPIHIEDYTLLFKGMADEQQGNARLRQAVVELYRGENLVDTLKPARSFYPTQPEPLNEVAIYRTLMEDFYMVVAGENPDGTATVRILINPLVMVIWMGFPLFTVGTFLAIFYRPRRLNQPLFETELEVAR